MAVCTEAIQPNIHEDQTGTFGHLHTTVFSCVLRRVHRCHNSAVKQHMHNVYVFECVLKVSLLPPHKLIKTHTDLHMDDRFR